MKRLVIAILAMMAVSGLKAQIAEDLFLLSQRVENIYSTFIGSKIEAEMRTFGSMSFMTYIVTNDSNRQRYVFMAERGIIVGTIAILEKRNMESVMGRALDDKGVIGGESTKETFTVTIKSAYINNTVQITLERMAGTHLDGSYLQMAKATYIE